jgi:RNA polymerase sigma-70 factor, ECF subfamily
MQEARPAQQTKGRAAVTQRRQAAFTELAEAHLAGAYRLATVILDDAFEGEDATHDALIAAWRQFGSLRDSTRFEAWFQRILVNACRDRLRRRRRRPSIEISHAPEPTTAGDEFGAVDDRVVLDAAFETLGSDHRVAIVLRFYGGLTVDEIAERTGVPAGTVKSRLHVATQRLHGALVGERGRRP